MVFTIIISILIVGCIYSFRHPYRKQSQKKSDHKPSTSVARKKPLPQDMLPVADSIIDAGPASGEALVRFSWNVSCYLHDDIRGMIWFADGPFQNYQPEQDHYVLFEYYGYIK